MNQKFKIIQVAENNIKKIEIIIATVSIEKEVDLQSNFMISTLYTFVFLKNSEFSNTLLSDYQQSINLDLNDFSLRKIEFDNIQNKFGYLHNELIDAIIDNTSLLLQKNNDLHNSLNDCISIYHLDMFFYFLYKIILIREFKNKELKVDAKLLFKKFQDILSVIIMDSYKVNHKNFDLLSELELSDIRNKYVDALEFISDFEQVISSHVSINKIALKSSREVLGDLKYSYSIYIQRTIIKAVDQIEQRIISHSNSHEYFGHEITITPMLVQLKIFPTLLGFTKLEELAKNWNNGQPLLEYLERNNFKQIFDSKKIDDFKTKWIINHSEIITPFYNDRGNSLNHFQFNKQKRSNIFQSLFNQGQINFTLI